LKVIHCNCSGDANPLVTAADATDSPALLHVALAKLKTDNPNNTQEVDTEEEDDTRN